MLLLQNRLKRPFVPRFRSRPSRHSGGPPEHEALQARDEPAAAVNLVRMSTPSCDPIAAINEAMSIAIDAQEAGDFRAAAKKARTAWMLCSALPDSELADERLRWKPDSIQPIVNELSRLAQSQPDTACGRGALFNSIDVEYLRG